MKQHFLSSFEHFKRDALAGTITGFMAVPLTIGICLMSDYPVMTGLYTVIFACIVGYISYLFRPGNYIGTPGVAAGLAPALALGVASFGMENMSFVILLTAVIQAVVWKYKLESYILKLVPKYLVEGLLAGVGLKIALKFIPFLYDIEHETINWLNFEREVVLLLSIVSFISFVLLHKYYRLKMPALPYLVIFVSSFILSFLIPLPKVSIDDVPFQLSLPLPHLAGLTISDSSFLLLKMFGFALMLASIDVIEQVMSNVAIEGLDPLKRRCDSNNSLQAIWIANLGASFFGGMTNLDGLAKSTTNAVAGAMTKLSNLFTALVLLLVVLFPSILAHLPEYALGVIMVYSGWKMIANIRHVKADGRYAIILSAVCAIMVFEFGIFEGLLAVLFAHGIIQFIFSKRLGKSNREIVGNFRAFLKEEDPHESSELESQDTLSEPQVPVLKKWLKAFNNRDTEGLMKLYAHESYVIPDTGSEILANNNLKSWFDETFNAGRFSFELINFESVKLKESKVDVGHLILKDRNQETKTLRFSFMIHKGKIIAQHLST